MPHVFTVEKIRASKVTQKWKLNNDALKSIRDTHEDPRGTPTLDTVDLTHTDPYMVKTVVRGVGMEYTLSDPVQPWSWLAFLNALSDDTLKRVVGDGVTGFVCMPLPESYDQKRHYAANTAGQPYSPRAPVPVWDFVAWRSDGTGMRMHPNQTNKKVSMTPMNSEYERVGPRQGRGNSDGPGTYRAQLAATYSEEGILTAGPEDRRHTRGSGATQTNTRGSGATQPNTCGSGAGAASSRTMATSETFDELRDLYVKGQDKGKGNGKDGKDKGNGKDSKGKGKGGKKGKDDGDSDESDSDGGPPSLVDSSSNDDGPPSLVDSSTSDDGPP